MRGTFRWRVANWIKWRLRYPVLRVKVEWKHPPLIWRWAVGWIDAEYEKEGRRLGIHHEQYDVPTSMRDVL